MCKLAKKIKINKKRKKKRTYRLADYAIPADHTDEIKESEKIDKYMDLVRELKKLWNMKVTGIPIVIGTLGTVPKCLESEMEEMEIR